MVKKKKAGVDAGKVSAKAAKKAKAAQKVERKEKKKVGKSKDVEDDEDLEKILDDYRREWEAKHAVTEEIVEGPPSRRANATLTACPSGNYLWCIGGEYFSEDGKAHFYNDVYRYTPDKNEWRKFVSPNCPGPRSAHAVVASQAAGGGEFSSLYQNSFHHYRDFWVFDITSHSWDRIDTKVRPSARSGCRMAMWKHYIILFGGFYDPGVRTNYLNDLWYFDTQEYHWKQVEFKETERRPTPRSGFSFLASPNGIVLHGGYCKEYAKGKRPVGIMLDDSWSLEITLTAPDATKPEAEILKFKWEKRKKIGYAPSLRSGCTMALWSNKSMGVLFGGVTDEDTNEETLESVFHNDLFGFQMTGKGRWLSLTLKRPKKQGGARKARAIKTLRSPETDSDEGSDSGHHIHRETPEPLPAVEPEVNPNDPILTTPLVRYNAMLAVLRNTLFIYGGIFERGSKEYTLDDFYALQLDKLDRYSCLKPCDVFIPAEGDGLTSSDDDDDDDDESDDEDDDGDADEILDVETASRDSDIKEGEVPQVVVEAVKRQDDAESEDGIRKQAMAALGTSIDKQRSLEDSISTPLPGETLAVFYSRSRDYWSGKALGTSDNRGKELRRDGFSLAHDRYVEYKPVLEEVEKILAEAGLDEEDIKKGAAAGLPTGSTASRNRR